MDLAGFLHGLAARGRAAEAVHADFEEVGGEVLVQIEDVADDGVFCDLFHLSFSFFRRAVREGARTRTVCFDFVYDEQRKL